MKKEKLINILKYYLILSLIPFLILDSVYIVDTVYLTLAVVFLAICISFLFKDSIFGLNKAEYIISAILSILFMGMLSFSEIINSSLFDNASLLVKNDNIVPLISFWIRVVYLPSVIISIFILMCSLIYFFIHSKFIMKQSSHVEKWTKGRCCILISVISILFLFSTYPGILIAGDVAGVWAEINAGTWSNWHTLGYEMFVAFCTFFYKSTFAVNIFQTFIWIGINFYILDILESYNKRSMRLYTFILTISLIPFVYLQISLKDVVFSFGMLALTAGIWNIARNQTISRKDFIMTALVALFVTLCRHMGWVAPIAGFCALFIYFIKSKKNSEAIKIIIISTCHILSYVVVYSVLFNVWKVADVPAYISYGTPMSIIGAAVQEGISFDEDDKETLERVMPLSEWGDCYNKYWADDMSRSWGKIGDRITIVEKLIRDEGYGKELIKINAKLFVKHPVLYSRALFDMNSIMWEIGRPADQEAMSPVTTIAKVSKDEQISYLTPFKMTNVLINFYDDEPILHSLFYRGGVSAFILFLSFFIFLLKRKKQYLFALLPIIVYSCLLAIAIPAQDTRYILPMMESAIFILAVIYGLGSYSFQDKISE